MKNCLVTGMTGFLGGAIVGKLKSQGDVVVGIERDENKRRDLKNLPDIFVKGDIRDYNFVRRVIADYEVEEVYHCAAQAIVKTCANDPYTTYDINVMGTVSLLEACRNSGELVKSVVVSTSDKAFGHAPIPYTEKTPLNPLYTYETSKACQQLITLSYFHNYGIPTKVIASSNVYGPGDPNLSRIVPNTIMRLAKGEPALIYEGADKHVREFVYIDDVANAFVSAARKGKNGEVYCCGGTEHFPVLELVFHICKEMGKDPEKDVKVFQKSRYFKEIEQQFIDSSKLKSIGWKPLVPFNEGIKRSIKYYTALAKKQ